MILPLYPCFPALSWFNTVERSRGYEAFMPVEDKPKSILNKEKSNKRVQWKLDEVYFRQKQKERRKQWSPGTGPIRPAKRVIIKRFPVDEFGIAQRHEKPYCYYLDKHTVDRCRTGYGLLEAASTQYDGRNPRWEVGHDRIGVKEDFVLQFIIEQHFPASFEVFNAMRKEQILLIPREDEHRDVMHIEVALKPVGETNK